jgi:hypothetical protein
VETREIRRANVIRLADGYGRIVDFCEKAGIRPAYYSQIKSRNKALGDDLARRMEENLGLTRGYFDVLQDAGEQSHKVTADTLSIAYAIEGLPDTMKDRIKMLVWSLSTELGAQKEKAQAQTSKPAAPGDAEEDGKAKHE